LTARTLDFTKHFKNDAAEPQGFRRIVVSIRTQFPVWIALGIWWVPRIDGDGNGQW
jgi:hypothetical protein